MKFLNSLSRWNYFFKCYASRENILHYICFCFYHLHYFLWNFKLKRWLWLILSNARFTQIIIDGNLLLKAPIQIIFISVLYVPVSWYDKSYLSSWIKYIKMCDFNENLSFQCNLSWVVEIGLNKNSYS